MPEPKLTPNFDDQLAAGQVQIPQPQGFSRPLVMPIPPKRAKVAIIGTAPSSRMMAPFNDMDWDIWVCSPGNMDLLNSIPRVDAWFEIHANVLWPGIAEAYGKNYLAWLTKQKFPVYLQDEPWHPKYFAHGISFPARQLVQKFGRHWFSSSFAWMMAFAIHKEQYREIGLYGVDMASKDEYVQQRQAFYRWLEFAQERGIKVTIPRESDLAQPPSLYGFSDATPYGRKLHARGDELKGRSDGLNIEIQKLQNQMDQFKANKFYIDGAREDNEYQQSIWMSLGDEWGTKAHQESIAPAPPVVSVTAQPPQFMPIAPFVVQEQEHKGNGTVAVPGKRKRGRPKGSKNKSETVAIT